MFQTTLEMGVNVMELGCRVCVYFIFSKGAKKALSSSDWSDRKSAWVAALVALGSGVLVVFVLLPILRRRSKHKFDK
jgi:hypothetical protein